MSNHEHTHEHGDNCACGSREHNEHIEQGHHDHSHHGHAHDENGNCILENHDAPGTVHVESHLHDEARVISGHLTIVAGYETVRVALSSALGHLAKMVQEHGGIVGHIKASCEVTQVEMFSVTDVDVSVKSSSVQEIKINLAAIVFLIGLEEAENMVSKVLEIIRKSADASDATVW